MPERGFRFLPALLALALAFMHPATSVRLLKGNSQGRAVNDRLTMSAHCEPASAPARK